MPKSIARAAMGAVLMLTISLGLTIGATSTAAAGFFEYRDRHYGKIYRPYNGYRPYRYPHWAPDRPAFVFYPAPYPVYDEYGPICARWGWIFNPYGEPRRRCVSW